MISVTVPLDDLVNVKLHDQSIREFLLEKLSTEAWAHGPVHPHETNLHHFENIVIGLLDNGMVQVTADVVRNEGEHGHL